MRDVGKERLEGWKIAQPRQRIVPERIRVQERMKREEEERLRKLKESKQGVERAMQVPTAA